MSSKRISASCHELDLEKLSVIFQRVARVLEALKYICCIEKCGQVILEEKKIV